MKVIVVSKAHEKISDFLLRQGNFEISFSVDNISSNIDLLTNNIIRVNKFILVITDDTDFTKEIRALMMLLDNPAGLIKIEELVFFFKKNINSRHMIELIGVVSESVKNREKDDNTYVAPLIYIHELESLSFDVLYKELMGKSTIDAINPKVLIKYRVERGEESKKAFEPSDEIISVSPYTTQNMEHHVALKTVLQKTENPMSLSAIEAIIPEYESLKLKAYEDLELFKSKWILITGDRMSGSTTHATAIAVSAAIAGHSVMVLDFTLSGGIEEALKIAAVKYHILDSKEILGDSLALIQDNLCIYENKSKAVLGAILPFMQLRQNLFNRDIIIILFDLADKELVFGSINTQICSVIFSCLMFQKSIDLLLSIDFYNMKTLIWLNDNISCPLRCHKLTVNYIESLLKKKNLEYKIIEPIFFEDFNLDASFYQSIEEVL